MKGILDRKILFGIIFLGLIIRLGWVIHLKDAGLIFADAGSYSEIATSLALGKGYSDREGNPTAARICGYPIFIGIIYFLFGVENLFAIRIIQAILGTLTLIFLFLLGRRVFNPYVGLIASFLASLNPYLIYYNGAILRETLFIFLVTLMLYFLFRINEGKKFIFLSSLFGGFSFLTNEAFVFYIPFLFIGSLIFLKGGIFGKISKTSLLFFFLLLIFSPWPLRNYLVLSNFTIRQAFYKEQSQSEEIWIRLWQGNNLYIGVDFEKECRYIAEDSIEELMSIPPDKRKNYVKKKALELIFSDPLRTLKVQIIKLGRFWRLYPHETKYLGTLTDVSNKRIKIISLLSDGWIIPIGLIGFLLALPLWKRHLFISLWIWGMCFGHVLLFYPMVRYRLPVMPFVMLFTGYGLFWGTTKIFKKLCTCCLNL